MLAPTGKVGPLTPPGGFQKRDWGLGKGEDARKAPSANPQSAIRNPQSGGAGAIPYAEAIQGTHVWSANSVDQVTDTPPAGSLLRKNWFWTLYTGRGMPVRGVEQGNPFESYP